MRKYLSSAIAGSAFLFLLAAPAVAGNDNQLYVMQQSPEGTQHGNTLMADQSEATGSLIRGLNPNLIGGLASLVLQGAGVNPEFALQRGEGNEAKLKLHGYGGELQLLQSNNPLSFSAAAYNTANVVAAANAVGGVGQVGTGNTANMELGEDARGLITQLGSNLTADLEVGKGGRGRIFQQGTGSSTGLVSVEPGATVTFTQIGDNVAPINSGLQVLIATNPGNITITQKAW